MSSLICKRGIKKVEVKDTKRDLGYQNQQCFVHVFLILVCCTIATRIGNFYRACDEEMLKSLLILAVFENYQ